MDASTGSLREGLPKARALNKVGHALHVAEPAFRASAQSAKLRGGHRHDSERCLTLRADSPIGQADQLYRRESAVNHVRRTLNNLS